MTNRYHKINFRRTALFAVCWLAMGSCTWEEFPELPPEQQKPVDLSFTTSVNKTPAPGTRIILPGTDFGSANSFPVSTTPYPIGMFLSNPNGSDLFDGAGNMKAEMKVNSKKPDGTDNASWDYFDQNDNPIIPRGFPGAQIRLTAYHPWAAGARPDSIPFDFTRKVNTDTGPGQAQTNLLLCRPYSTKIPTDPANNPIPLGFRNAYTKIVLRVTKREDKNDPENKGLVKETAIENLTADWIKNRGGIDLATGYVKSTSEPGKIWNDSTATLKTNVPVEFTFLVPAFMDKAVRDDQFGFVLQIDGQPRLFPLKQSQLNTGTDAAGNPTYGFEQNKINTYNLVYNNSILFLTLQSWNTIDASANFGETAENDPTFQIDLSTIKQYSKILDQSFQEAARDYPKDQTQDPLIKNSKNYHYNTTHVNNTLLSSVLLGGNGRNILESEGNQMYDLEKNYVKLQVTAFEVGGKAVVWQDENGGLVAKDICRNYRGNGKSDWRLPRVTEMKLIIMWAINYADGKRNLAAFLGQKYESTKNYQLKRDESVPYWTATEADMGTPGVVDDLETAWYVQGIYDANESTNPPGESRNAYNYKVMTRNKQDAAFVRCVREL